MDITIVGGKSRITSDGEIVYHTYEGNAIFSTNGNHYWNGKQGNIIGEYEKVNSINLSSNKKIYKENIVITASEVHDKGPQNKLMFMAQAVRAVKLYSVQTVLYFKHGYSATMINEFENALKKYKPKIKIIALNNLQELINYINTGYTDAGHGDYRTKYDENNEMYKINNVYIYSHGLPSRITFMLDWDLYKEKNNLQSSETAEGNELNLNNYTLLNPKSFNKGSVIWSYACRTGLTDNDSTDVEFFWDSTESLAQRLADYLDLEINAYVKRSNYENTWGSLEDRQILKVTNKLHSIIDLDIDNEFREYLKGVIKIDNKYPWNRNGAFGEVRAGDTPKGPPNCLCTFKKNKKILVNIRKIAYNLLSLC